jgi:hypothetical protein
MTIFTSPSRRVRRARTFAILGGLLALSLACVSEVDGDRATTGTCPEGETCSDATPMGLRFVGQIFFDDETAHLGPILAGGRFDLGLRTPDGAAVPPWTFTVENASVLGATTGTGTFGPVDETGRPEYPVDGYLTLRGGTPGDTYVRILDASSGDLLDRILLDVYELRDVRIRNASGPSDDALVAGCESMIGVRLIATDGMTETEIGGFDQDVTVSVGGELRRERRFWDCFLYTVPAGATSADIEVTAAGRVFAKSMPVVTLESTGLTECPAVSAD